MRAPPTITTAALRVMSDDAGHEGGGEDGCDDVACCNWRGGGHSVAGHDAPIHSCRPLAQWLVDAEGVSQQGGEGAPRSCGGGGWLGGGVGTLGATVVCGMLASRTVAGASTSRSDLGTSVWRPCPQKAGSSELALASPNFRPEGGRHHLPCGV